MDNNITNRRAIEALKINPALYNAVFSAFPQKLDKFEESIYIYIKLCSILSYDAQYWATENDDYLLDQFKRHIDLNSISTISPTNSEVVCVDFNLIFCKMLLLRGIKSHTFARGQLSDDDTFGMYHTDVIIPLPNLFPLHNANFSEKELNNVVLTFAGYYDMNNVKLYGKATNIDYSGFTTNKESLKNFIDSTNKKITNLIKQEQIDKLHSNSNEEKVKILIERYQKIEKESNLPTKRELIQNFFNEISKQDMPTYPALMHASIAFKNTLEQLNNEHFVAKFSIVRERDSIQDDLFHMIGLITIGPKNNLNYIKFIPPTKLESINKQELQNKFNCGDIDYITNLMPRPKHLVPHIYSPYLECRYRKLFKTWDSSEFFTMPYKDALARYDDESITSNSNGTIELFDYYDTWHRAK